jgi:amidase/aspartyl-tRNA(Asn)/glutamyl-tRNA(Gln) amidotransferase subunit A
MRTHVYDQLQQVLRSHNLLVTPTLACLPVPNADNGNTVGPSSVQGVDVDPLIGWCLTYLLNYTGHPAASAPAGDVDGLPVGMQVIPALRRRGRLGRKWGLRTDPSLA